MDSATPPSVEDRRCLHCREHDQHPAGQAQLNNSQQAAVPQCLEETSQQRQRNIREDEAQEYERENYAPVEHSYRERHHSNPSCSWTPRLWSTPSPFPQSRERRLHGQTVWTPRIMRRAVRLRRLPPQICMESLRKMRDSHIDGMV